MTKVIFQPSKLAALSLRAREVLESQAGHDPAIQYMTLRNLPLTADTYVAISGVERDYFDEEDQELLRALDEYAAA